MAIPDEDDLYEYQRHMRDALLYGMGFAGHRYWDVFRSAPLHGAIDFEPGPDGVWRLPGVWSDGDTIHFGVDLARPDSDQTVVFEIRKEGAR